jgi:hypothetical protein
MTVRQRLIDRSLLDAEGNLTPAGERWTDELIVTLRRARADAEKRGLCSRCR